VTEADPFRLFSDWLADAVANEPNDPTAMALATVSPEGWPAVRMVLLKGHDARGFAFYTNRQSRKGVELDATRRAALLFHWKSLRRQIRIEGPVEDASAQEADAYFATRARLSRLGAIASDQSRPLASRAELESRLAALEATYPGNDIPRPPHWSGYRVVPQRFEFWQEAPFRLHDRTIYVRDGDGWTIGKLYP
jgi:pyridoxamine 5'-phosphate oxidase